MCALGDGEDIPETGVPRGPLELVLLTKMNGEVVAAREALVTHVTFVPRLRVSLKGRRKEVSGAAHRATSTPPALPRCPPPLPRALCGNGT